MADVLGFLLERGALRRVLGGEKKEVLFLYFSSVFPAHWLLPS